MEKFYGSLRATGKDLNTAAQIRLEARPSHLGGFEDLGTSLSPKKRPTAGSRLTHGRTPKPLCSTQRNNSRPDGATNKSQKVNQRTTTPIEIDSDSDDEMDLLSSQTEDDFRSFKKAIPTGNRASSSIPERTSSSQNLKHVGSTSKRANSPLAMNSEKEYVDPEGKRHLYHPNHLPSKQNSLANLKFKKNKNCDKTSESLNPTSSPKTVPQVAKENKYDREYALPNSMQSSFGSQSSKDKADSKLAEVDNPFINAIPLSVKSAISNSRVRSSPPPLTVPKEIPMHEVRNGATTRIRPRPRGSGGESSGFRSNAGSLRPQSSQVNLSSSLVNVLDATPVDIPSSAENHGSKNKRHAAPSRPIVILSSPEASPQKSVTKITPAPFASSPKIQARKPLEFPSMSPLRNLKEMETHEDPQKRQAFSSRLQSAFPLISPQSKNLKGPMAETGKSKENEKRKSKTRATSISPDDVEEVDPFFSEEKSKKKHKKKVQAFPMSTQVLASIGSPSAPSSFKSPTSRSKRSSEGGSEDERIAKKYRKERDVFLDSPSRIAFDDEGYSITMPAHVDPSTLCPYCDTPLPSNPSPHLLKILSNVLRKSSKDPRPSNPLGRKAPLAAFIAACQRHRFESEILPEAERKGWPKSIEWNELAPRILRMRGDLKDIINDEAEEMDEGGDWEVVYSKKQTKVKKKSSKASSIFWMEIMDDVKKKGLRAVSGVRGQFANFEKAQPGYYGELGSVIIHQTLYDMFPLAEMDPALISPLTANEFVQRILVPEVAMRLIMEDKGLEGEEGMRQGLTILRESSAYGVAMFPEDGGESGGSKKRGEEENMGVGDMIVMERARKRRKELEEEDEREEEERRLGEEKEAKAKELAKDTGKRGKQKAKTDDEEAPPLPEEKRPRPRPRPIMKTSSSMSVVEAPFADDPAPMRITRSRSQSINHRDIDLSSNTGPQVIELTDSDSGMSRRAHYTQERSRSPSASEFRRPRSSPVATDRELTARPRRSPSTSESRKSSSVVTNHVRTSLSLDSDSGTSTKATVNGGKRACSRARSIKVKNRMKDSKEMDVVSDKYSSNDSEVEVIAALHANTPVSKRLRQGATTLEIDEDLDTPKALHALYLKPSHSEPELPPLLRAQQRHPGINIRPGIVSVIASKTLPKLSGRIDSSTSGVDSNIRESNFNWLLSDSSQSSAGGKWY